MRFDLPPSWDAGYAIPTNVRREPPRRAQLPGGYSIRRRTYDDPGVPPPWDPGYALPENIRDEQLGQSTITTKWLPRGTIAAAIPPLLPEAYADVIDALHPSQSPINGLSGSEWLDAQSWRYGMGGLDTASTHHLDRWSERVANAVISEIRKVPTAQRAQALRMSLDALEPGLAARVLRTVKQVPRQPAALRRAIADATRAGLIGEVLDLAAGQNPAPQSLIGLGATHRVVVRRGTPVVDPRKGLTVTTRRHSATGSRPPGLACAQYIEKVTKGGREGYRFQMPWAASGKKKLEKLRIPNFRPCMDEFPGVFARYERSVKKHGPRVSQGIAPFVKWRDERGKLYATFYNASEGSARFERVRSDTPWYKQALRILVAIPTMGHSELFYRRSDIVGAGKAVGKAAGRAGKEVGKAVGKAGKEVGKAVGKVAEKVGGATCDLLSSDKGQLAIAAGATAAGAPPDQAMVGTQVAAGICQSGSPQGPPAPDPERGVPLGPILMIGGAVVAAFLLSR